MTQCLFNESLEYTYPNALISVDDDYVLINIPGFGLEIQKFNDLLAILKNQWPDHKYIKSLSLNMTKLSMMISTNDLPF